MSRKLEEGVSPDKGRLWRSESYATKKLWKLLIDRGLNNVELQKMTGLSSATITKLGAFEDAEK